MKTHARKHSEEVVLQALHMQAHRLRHAQGRTWDEIVAIVGVRRSTRMSWGRRFNPGSPTLEHTNSAWRGRRLGAGRTLESAEKARLREIRARQPALGGVAAVCTVDRRAIQAAVQSYFGVDMPLRTATKYLHRWGCRGRTTEGRWGGTPGQPWSSKEARIPQGTLP